MDARRQLINELQSTISERLEASKNWGAMGQVSIAFHGGRGNAFHEILQLLNELEQDCDLADEGNADV